MAGKPFFLNVFLPLLAAFSPCAAFPAALVWGEGDCVALMKEAPFHFSLKELKRVPALSDVRRVRPSDDAASDLGRGVPIGSFYADGTELNVNLDPRPPSRLLDDIYSTLVPYGQEIEARVRAADGSRTVDLLVNKSHSGDERLFPRGSELVFLRRPPKDFPQRKKGLQRVKSLLIKGEEDQRYVAELHYSKIVAFRASDRRHLLPTVHLRALQMYGAHRMDSVHAGQGSADRGPFRDGSPELFGTGFEPGDRVTLFLKGNGDAADLAGVEGWVLSPGEASFFVFDAETRSSAAIRIHSLRVQKIEKGWTLREKQRLFQKEKVFYARPSEKVFFEKYHFTRTNDLHPTRIFGIADRDLTDSVPPQSRAVAIERGQEIRFRSQVPFFFEEANRSMERLEGSLAWSGRKDAAHRIKVYSEKNIPSIRLTFAKKLDVSTENPLESVDRRIERRRSLLPAVMTWTGTYSEGLPSIQGILSKIDRCSDAFPGSVVIDVELAETAKYSYMLIRVYASRLPEELRAQIMEAFTR